MNVGRVLLLMVIIGTIAAIVEFEDDRALGFDDIGGGRSICFEGTAIGMQPPLIEDVERRLKAEVSARGNRLVKTGRSSFAEIDGVITVARYHGGTMTERVTECPKPPRPECKRWPGEFWAEALRRAGRYKAGKAYRPKNDAHYWAGKIVEAHGFMDAQGMWHPEPKNCVA